MPASAAARKELARRQQAGTATATRTTVTRPAAATSRRPVATRPATTTTTRPATKPASKASAAAQRAAAARAANTKTVVRGGGVAAGGGRIGGYSEAHLLAQAKKIVDKKAAVTTVFDEEADDRLPTFETNELMIGKLLGKGGFCAVSEVVKVALKGGGGSGKHYHGDDYGMADVVQDRNFMQTNYIRKGKDYRYAVKKCKPEIARGNDAGQYVNAVVDLALEARFLAVVRHPNIIKLRAVSNGTPYSKDYFLVMDRLLDILTRTLVGWKKKKNIRNASRRTEFWVERVTVAHDLATALKYLHGMQILYRDLKPDNIGFDVRGDVKIFDFGLARQLPRGRLANGTYRMTGDTGSPRYMAPEVALEKPYNLTADVYGFSVLLHQILSLDNPYDKYNMGMMKKNIWMGGGRPKVDPKWPKRIQTLLLAGWSANVAQRPSMNTVVQVLRDEIAEKTNMRLTDVLDASGKSQRSAHGR